MKMYTVIAFDISDDQRRYRVARALESVAVRIQRSVFDGTMEEAVLLRLRSEIEGKIDTETDCVVYFRLCRACAQRRVVVGRRYVGEEGEEPWKVI
jgi:CRISPR-associated protein Cas2